MLHLVSSARTELELNLNWTVVLAIITWQFEHDCLLTKAYFVNEKRWISSCQLSQEFWPQVTLTQRGYHPLSLQILTCSIQVSLHQFVQVLNDSFILFSLQRYWPGILRFSDSHLFYPGLSAPVCPGIQWRFPWPGRSEPRRRPCDWAPWSAPVPAGPRWSCSPLASGRGHIQFTLIHFNSIQ